MGLVYSSSACAFIWLGPGDKHTDQALRFIDSLEDMFSEYAVRLDDPDVDDWNYLHDLLDDAILPSDGHAWAGLVALFSRPWFNRCWTLQEPIRAPDRTIACGSKIWNWNIFSYAALVCAQGKYSDRKHVNVEALLVIQGAIKQGSKNLRLSELIYTSQKREASEPRDKVYALYGLVQDNQKVPLEISYAMSVEDIYRSTVRFCIENEEKLSILIQVSEYNNTPDLPSWVPNWRDQTYSGCIPVGGPWNEEFNASSTTRPLLAPSSSSDKLILKGFVLAIVERTIQRPALLVNPVDSSPGSWKTNAAAAGVPVRFLQGKTFQTSYDLTTTIEKSPFHNTVSEGFARTEWPNSARWFAAGSRNPMPQAVLLEYKRSFDSQTNGKCLFLTKDSLGLAPEPTQVGDIVCILLGGNAPFILRPRLNAATTTPDKGAKPKRQSAPKTTPQGITKSRHQGTRKSRRVVKQALKAVEWTLIGDCYLYGYMRGEAMETVTEADYMNFTLV